MAFETLGGDGFVLTTNRTAVLRANAQSVALSGASSSTYATSHYTPRGAIYGAMHLLRLLGIKFLAWDETLLPSSAAALGPVDLTFVPHFEYRLVYGWSALATPEITQLFHQSDSPYADPPGGVHTSYRLFGPDHPAGSNCTSSNGCPPPDLFKTNNEWFWPRDDAKAYGQLCWSNTSLISYLAKSAAAMLALQPHAKVISISQNDNSNYCNSSEERAIVQEDGALMGPLLRAVNAIAKELAAKYPDVAVDTLACELHNAHSTRNLHSEPNRSTVI